MSTLKYLVILCLAALAGCGGSNSGGATSGNQSASPGGIWTGTDSSTGMQVTALIAESGYMDVIRSDRAQFIGTVIVNGNSISANIEGDAEYGSRFPDGSIHGTGTVTGTLTQRSKIQATVSFTTDKGESTSTTVILTFQSAYLTTPNVANFAGTYTDANSGATVSINSAGVIFAQDPTTGCVINGQINVIQGNYNLWAALIDYANCQGSLSVLNGLEFAGFVELNGNNVLAGLQDKSGKHYGLVFSLTKP